MPHSFLLLTAYCLSGIMLCVQKILVRITDQKAKSISIIALQRRAGSIIILILSCRCSPCFECRADFYPVHAMLYMPFRPDRICSRLVAPGGIFCMDVLNLRMGGYPPDGVSI